MEKPSPNAGGASANPDSKFEEDLQTALALSIESHALETFRKNQSKSSSTGKQWLQMGPELVC